MKLVSTEAIKRDIATINSQIASLTAQRDALSHALSILKGEAIVAGTSPVPLECEPLPAEPAPRRKRHSTVKLSGGAKNGYSTEKLRDVVLGMTGEFTMSELVARTGVHKSTVRKYLKELIRLDIVKQLSDTRPAPVVNGQTLGRTQILYCYNSEIPAGPTSRPTQPTPESELIGATPPRGQALGNGTMSNGHVFVSDTMIQGFINAAIKQGWTVAWKEGQGSHLKFTSPDGRTVGVNAKPPSKQIGLVIKRDLKRSGLTLA